MSSIPMSGPGKFEGEAEFVEYLYALSLDGANEECGGELWGMASYACKLDGPFDLSRFHEIMGREPTAEEAELLTGTVGAILTEDSQGFVHGELYCSAEEYERSWDEILDEFERSWTEILDEFEEC